MARRIPLSGKNGEGRFAIVDDEDFDHIREHKWWRRGRYAYRSGGEGEPHTVYMHRDVVGELPEGVEVDHANGNGMDNRRKNLRPCSRRLNNANGARENRTGYRGVESRAGGGYCARIWIDGKKRVLGEFDRIEDAAKAFDAAAVEQYDEFATLNFPTDSAVKNPAPTVTP